MVNIRVVKPFYDLKRHVTREEGDVFEVTEKRAEQLDLALPGYIVIEAEQKPEPAAVEAAEWQPRQEIVAVELPTVPDEEAALPRLVIPKVARVAHAADITPPFDLMPSTGGSGGGVGGKVSPTAVLVISNGTTKMVNVKSADSLTKILDMVPDFVNRFTNKGGASAAADDIKVEDLNLDSGSAK